MRKIIISIALVVLMLTGCSKNEGKTTAVENIATDTVATIGDASADATTEEVVGEPAPEKETLEAEATTEAVPATTEIGGGKKKEDTDKSSTTESTKPSTNHSNASSNGGSADNGQSTTPKPSNSGSSFGNSGNSNSSGKNSSSSGNNNSNNGGSSNSGSSNSGNNTPQHQHNYNVWVKTKDAYDEKVIDQAAYDETIEHPEEGYWADAVQCRMCGQVFTSIDALAAHPCGGRNYGTADDVWVKTKDAWTETKHHDEKSHVVHHDEEGYWKCECGARK